MVYAGFEFVLGGFALFAAWAASDIGWWFSAGMGVTGLIAFGAGSRIVYEILNAS